MAASDVIQAHYQYDGTRLIRSASLTRPANQLNRALDQAGVSKSRAERNAAMVDHYNSQVLKERQQVLREALAERPVSKAEEQHWLAQRWPRLPMESVPRAPPPEEWENI